MPPEWHPQDWLWIGFPHDAREWPGFLEPAQEQIAAFASAVAESGQEVRLIVRDEANEARARKLVSGAVKLERRRYGDIWLRDTGPLVVMDGQGRRIARRFGFNGWGGEYMMEGDNEIGAELAPSAGPPVEAADWILGGGARFVAPGVLALPVASGTGDPNAAIYADARDRARAFSLAIRDVPSPGPVGEEGAEPASYMNFAITSKLVVVPTYGSPYDAEGVAAVAALFPDRETIGLPADAVLAGGGSFHCASQQMPSAA